MWEKQVQEEQKRRQEQEEDKLKRREEEESRRMMQIKQEKRGRLGKESGVKRLSWRKGS